MQQSQLKQLIRKGQAAILNLMRDFRGEARIIERAFGKGPSALAEAVALIGENAQLLARLKSCNERTPNLSV